MPTRLAVPSTILVLAPAFVAVALASAFASGAVGAASTGAAPTPIVVIGSPPDRAAGDSGDAFRAGASGDAAGAEASRAGRDRGWPFHLSEPIASPFLYDVNGDGTDEVIIADGLRAYVLDVAGNPLPGWPRSIPQRADNCGAAGDIDGDGQVEVLFGIEGAPPLLYVYRADGTNKPGFPVQLPYRYWMNCSSPVLADLNGDGRTEIGIGVEIGVAFFDAQGHSLPGWPFTWSTSQNLAWSAPAVGDIDGDGQNEVVVGENNIGSYGVYAIRADGTLMPGWPKATSPVFSSPSLADIDGDGVLEVIIQDGDSTWMGYHLYAWNGDGTDVPGFPKALTTEWNGSRANPAVGDVDGDGGLEIVTVTSDGLLHVVRSNGMDFAGYPKLTPGVSLISSPELADVNGDGKQEIFLAYIIPSGSQWVNGWRLDGMALPGFPKMLLASSQLAVHASTHVRDIDGDGVFEIVACGTDFSNGSCCLFDVDGSHYVEGVTRCEWPKIRRDVANSGLYGGRDPADAGDPRVLAVESLTIVPNPALPGETVLLRAPRGERGAVTVLDPSGRVLGMRPLAGEARIDVRDLLGGRPANGVYFVRFRSEEGRGPCGAGRLVVLQ